MRINNAKILHNAILFSGAPYKDELMDAINGITDSISMSANPFRYQKNTDFIPSDKELLELLDKIS